MPELPDRVVTNLVHYNQWTEVKLHRLEMGMVISGMPPSKLDLRDEENRLEWVVPKLDEAPIQVKEIGKWMEIVNGMAGEKVGRFTMGLEGLDGTVVYYFIYDDVTKPRQN